MFIHCEQLVKIYQAAGIEVFALQGLDLQIAAGEMVAVVGRSGSGKSTLLNILGGLDVPTAGTCRVGEWDLLRLSSAQRVAYMRQAVGFVWQNNARNLIPYLRAVENVETPMLLAGVPARAARSRALDLLEAVGLSHRAYHRLTALSGGEQQRVAIAIGLSNQPRLLLADEPTGSVDTATVAQILQVFRTVRERYGTTVLVVTHDPALARAVDRFVLIQDGKISQEMRHAGESDQRPDAGAPEPEPLVVLDRAGRLQLPREMLNDLGLTTHAKVTQTGDGILIQKP